jgi:DNA modification methylase
MNRSPMIEPSEQWTLPLGTEPSSLPSAKQRPGNISQPWGKFLAAFSPTFAESAIRALQLAPSALLFDPFCGSGTTLVAAAKLGVRAVGNDLDPVSAVISRARVAFNFSRKKVQEFLKPGPGKRLVGFADGVMDYFELEDLLYASSVFTRLRCSISLRENSLLPTLLADETGALDSHSVALAALLNAACASARVVRGSNPVWHRKPVPGERIETERLARTANEGALEMMQDLSASRRSATKGGIRVLCGDARTPLLPNESVDGILTSPPYLNRLDYVVNHLPQLLVLTGVHSIDVEGLRSRMTGTTKILRKAEIDSQAGTRCIELLEKIKNHSSYASKRYYLHIYVQYFNDMLSVLRQLKRQCRSGASGIMVVQTSYYKDVLIDLAAIFPEMASNLGFKMQPISSEEVSMHYGNLSPRQLKYVPKKRLREWILRLGF